MDLDGHGSLIRAEALEQLPVHPLLGGFPCTAAVRIHLAILFSNCGQRLLQYQPFENFDVMSLGTVLLYSASSSRPALLVEPLRSYAWSALG